MIEKFPETQNYHTKKIIIKVNEIPLKDPKFTKVPLNH